MDQDLENKVQHCKECQENQKMPPPVPLQPWEWPNRPWSRLHLDFAGPFMGRMFLVMVDAHTKWLEAHILKNITAFVTVDTLRQVFSVHGLPDVVVTDNGPTFTGEMFQEFVKRNGIGHIRTAPFHPASNGLAERAVQTLKEGLKKMSGASVETNISRFLFQYRITPQTTTGLAPAEMLLGRKLKSHLDLLHPDVEEKVRVQQGKQKAWHDRHARAQSFQEGETVFVRNFARGQRWLPGAIMRKSGPRSCVVRLSDGREVRRHQDHLRSHPATEQWGCVDQAGGSDNMGSSGLEEAQSSQQLPPAQSSEEMTVPVPLRAPVPLDSVPNFPEKTVETLRRSERQKKAPKRLNL